MKLKPLSAADTLIITVILLGVLGSVIYLFGSDSLAGGVQIAMMSIGCAVALIGMKNGLTWQQIERGIVEASSRTTGPILIFLSIGSFIAALMLSGSVPTLLYLGLSVLSPTWFYPTACFICALVSICIGSSWTTAATIGVGLIGVSYGFSLSPEITAGAIISGAYFGDKMSPLSETTNLAPAIAGTELFAHIRHMVWVSGPSFLVALTLFAVVGFFSTAQVSAAETDENIRYFLTTLDDNFTIAWYNLAPIVLLLVLVVREVPAFLSIVTATFAACLFALFFQPVVVETYIAKVGASGNLLTAKGIWIALYDGFVIESGHDKVDELLSRGGMASMIVMVWLVISSMMMTGVLQRVGYIDALLRGLVKLVRSTGSLIATTLGTCFGCNLLTGDQYLSIVLPGEMWKEQYARQGLEAKNLSRTLEDAGTVTSPLIPWNGCGVYMAGTLGVATMSYLPFCFFNLLNPLIALAYGFLNIKITRIDPAQTGADSEAAIQQPG